MYIANLADEIIAGKQITKEEAEKLIKADFYSLLFQANKLKEAFKGNEVDLCAIVNAKSGICSENCKFCAQSSHYNTSANKYPLITKDKMTAEACEAKKIKALRFGIVTSGAAVNEQEITVICESMAEFKKDIAPCVSLGSISEASIKKLKAAGLTRYHHNLETSEKFFPNICTTHTYQERINTLKLLKANGLQVCSGCLFGLGEEFTDRIDLAFTLKELNVDSVPLNFLFPVKGTPLENQAPLPPLEILRTIAIFRIILSDKDIKICGGRDSNLRDLQSFIFFAGANGMMIGNYLTTAGRNPQDDLRMIKDLGFTIKDK